MAGRAADAPKVDESSPRNSTITSESSSKFETWSSTRVGPDDRQVGPVALEVLGLGHRQVEGTGDPGPASGREGQLGGATAVMDAVDAAREEPERDERAREPTTMARWHRPPIGRRMRRAAPDAGHHPVTGPRWSRWTSS